MNTEYVRKGKLLEWLFGRKKIFETCVESAKRKNPTVLSLHEEDLEMTEQFINEVLSMDTFTVNGETSDGYHTFNELYHHRAVLFSVIVSMYPEISWKSRKHSDGTMYDGMFIVGIDTPGGQATYHYNNEYWNIFKCVELDAAPEYDGHTPEQAIKRIGTLRGMGNVRRNQNDKKH